MISAIQDLLMPDELPSGDRAVYVFLEILAFCFALASVDSLVARHWLASLGYMIAAVVFFVAGIKWPRIKQHLYKKPRASASLPLALDADTGAQSEKREIVNVTPEHLTGFYSQGHTSVQASKLAEAFLGKWMKVSGPLGDVLGNYDHQRMVVFSDRSIHDHNFVNMFFRDKERFGQLSTLKCGDMITVIGQLRDVNSLEIWLENCELLDS